MAGNLVVDSINGVDISVSPPATQVYANSYDLGVGQTWQDVTASRVAGTTYTNSTGKPIMVSIIGTVLAQYTTGSLIVNGLTLDTYQAFVASANGTVCGIIPNGATYSTTGFSGISSCKELR